MLTIIDSSPMPTQSAHKQAFVKFEPIILRSTSTMIKPFHCEKSVNLKSKKNEFLLLLLQQLLLRNVNDGKLQTGPNVFLFGLFVCVTLEGIYLGVIRVGMYLEFGSRATLTWWVTPRWSMT